MRNFHEFRSEQISSSDRPVPCLSGGQYTHGTGRYERTRVGITPHRFLNRQRRKWGQARQTEPVPIYRRLRDGVHLGAEQVRVNGARFEKVCVSAVGHELAFVEHRNFCDELQNRRAEAMGNEHGGTITRELAQGLVNQQFAMGVNRGGWLVKNE